MGVFVTGRQVALEILMPGWWLSGASVDMDFRNGRYYDGANPNTVSLPTDFLSCTRASTGYAKNSAGTWVSFSANQLRITDLGLLVEDARTNNLLNSDTPATQTTASLATGSYTLWVEGSGSALASAGSATITGAASATQGSSNTFTVTVAGTVTVTVTGSLTRFQLEAGAFASSYIPTTGTSATRAADVTAFLGSVNTILSSGTLTIVADVKANRVAGALSPNHRALNADAAGQLLVWADFSNKVVTFDGSVFVTLPAGLDWTTGIKFGLSGDGTGRSIAGGGGTVGTMANVIPSVAQTLCADGFAIFYYFRRITVWNTRLADATLQALTAP